MALGVVLIGLPDVVIASPAGASTTTIFGQSVTPGTATTLSLPVAANMPTGIAYDSSGDLFIANFGTNSITVLPAVSGTLFGQSVTANVATQLAAATGLNGPFGLALDANGDLLIANAEGSDVSVLPASTGTIFGQSVTANVTTQLTAATGLEEPVGVALDANGDLFVSNLGNGNLTVVPASSGTIFGQSVTANQATTIAVTSGTFGATGIAFDASGDLFIANYQGDTVLVIPASSGTIFGQSVTADVVTILSAATGLVAPFGVTFDASGNLFIGDAQGSGVSVLPLSSGTIFGQSVTANVAAPLTAATGLGTPFGITFNPNGDFVIANVSNNTVSEISSIFGSISNQASILSAATGLDNPWSVVIDANGDLFISNTSSNSISVLPASTGILFGQSVTANQITTLSAAVGLNNPIDMVFDANGDLFISNDGANSISVLPASTGTLFGQSVTANQITTLSATVGQLAPFGMAIDANGDLFGAEISSNTVIVVPQSSGTIFGQSVTANQVATLNAATGLSAPVALVFDASGNLFVSNNDNNQITVVPASSGTLFGQSVTANVAAQLTAATGLTGPQGLAEDGAGDLFIVNHNANSVTVLPASTSTVFGQSMTANVATQMSGATGLGSPVGISFNSAGDLFVANDGANTISVVLASTTPLFGQTAIETTLATTVPTLNGPTALAFDASGDLFVSNNTSNTVTVIPSSSGTLFGQSVSADEETLLGAATGLNSPFGLAVDANGDLFIVNNNTNTVTVVPSSTGTLFGQSVTANVATTLSAAAGLNSPYGIAIDANGDLFISNVANDTVTVVPTRSGTIFGQSVTANMAATLTAASGLGEPVGVALNASGDLFVSNLGSSSITVVPASTGTLFGQSVTANTAATLTAATGLDVPYDLAVDANGNLFIVNNNANTLTVVPSSTATLFGQSVTANVATTLSAATGLDGPETPVFDTDGDLFVSNFDNSSITVLPFLSAPAPNPGAGSTGTTSATSPNSSSIVLSLPRNVTAVVRGALVTVTATLSVPGSVSFADNGLIIAACANVTTASDVATCLWIPSRVGTNALSATLTPTSPQESSSTSLTTNVSVIGRPGAPKIKRLFDRGRGVTLVITRRPPAGGARILGYQYAVNGVWHLAKLSRQHRVTIVNLQSGRTYRVRLRARNRVGYGLASNTLTVRLP